MTAALILLALGLIIIDGGCVLAEWAARNVDERDNHINFYED